MFTLRIETDNAAFEDDPFELARILREIAARVENYDSHGIARDINGNNVGEWNLS